MKGWIVSADLMQVISLQCPAAGCGYNVDLEGFDREQVQVTGGFPYLNDLLALVRQHELAKHPDAAVDGLFSDVMALPESSVYLLRGDFDWDVAKDLSDRLRREKPTALFFMAGFDSDIDLQALDDEFMARHGWVRRDADPQDWPDLKPNEPHAYRAPSPGFSTSTNCLVCGNPESGALHV